MATGDQYRRIEPSDLLVFDDENNLVGLRSGKSDSAELRLGAPLTAAQVQAVQAMLAGTGALPFPGQVLVLKAFTGRSHLTGGTVSTKVPLMEVPIPDGWLSRLDVRMDIEASFNWTNSANTKEWGISIGPGTAAGGVVGDSVDIRTLSFTTTASISDKIVLQRSAETPTRFFLAVPNNARYFGNTASAGTTVGVLASASIDPDSTGRSLWVWGRLGNIADQVSLEHLFVQMQRGVS